MGFGRWFGRRSGLSVAASPPRFKFDAPIKPIDQMFAELRGQGVAPRVTKDEALSVPVVQRGRNLLCSIASLPLVQRGPDNAVVRNPLLEQIDPDVGNIVTLAQTVEDLVFEGIAWWRILGFGFDLFPVSSQHLDPSRVSLDPPAGGSPSPLPSGVDPRHAAVVWVDGEPVPADQIIRFDSPNPAVLKVGGRAIKRAILLDQAARMYADDPRPNDYFSPAEGADPADDDEIKDILDKWTDSRKRRATGYVPASLKYETVDSPSPAEMQLVELQRQASLDIANAFGVDPEDLGVSTTSRTYQNDVDRRRARINDVLSPYMRAITDRLSMGDVTKRGYRVDFDLDDYLKSNPTERWSTYKTAVDMGVMDVEEIREREGLPPRVTPSAPAGPANPDTVPAGPSSTGASASLAVSFDDSAPLRFADVPVAEFSVDSDARTIEGLALPYGKIGTKAGLKFRFDRGALQVTEASRVKLLRDHDPSQPLGVATDLKDTPAGFKVKFKVARGAAGDEALALAEDGVLDGLSVGVDFDFAADTAPDPRNKGVALVRRADLREVSLTAMPAFDDARVTKVAASRDGGNMTEPATGGAPPVVADPAPQTMAFTAEQLAALLGRQNVPTPAEPAEPEQRQIVNPTRLTASTTVTDPAPYRFDSRGNLMRGSHDFSQDLFAAQGGDAAAMDRATDFVRAQFDVATTDVNELNPTRNRPDLYVDQRDFRYPIWDAVNKGTLTDITPFTFPKFSSASGLVAAHTEGNEPSSGTYVTTSQTVTPTAISGKAKITRETFDQGGNPQVSNLIWRQMLKGWFEALEAAAVTVLDAASPTQIDLSGTPGLADDGLDQAITAAFAALQFVRGGFSMDNLFTQIDLYKALVAATDADGRRLYPAMGPTNANGTVRGRWAALDINGVTALPAWALAATGTVAASSYLFDSESVHGWASAPQRLEFNIEVAHVYIGIWGYKATAISDINGVREIVYDPA
jgi:HK97 family phage prohead protease